MQASSWVSSQKFTTYSLPQYTMKYEHWKTSLQERILTRTYNRGGATLLYNNWWCANHKDNTKLRKSAFYYTFTREKPTCTTTVTPGKVCCRETGQDELYISDLPHLYARASFLGNSVARHAVGAQLINFDCPGSVFTTNIVFSFSFLLLRMKQMSACLYFLLMLASLELFCASQCL